MQVLAKLVPWRDVERWTCIRCGKCCSELDVQLSYEEERRLLKYGNVLRYGKVGVYIRKTGGRCVFYDAGRCTIYPERPVGCKKYPFYIRPWTSDENERSAFMYMGRVYSVWIDESCRGVGTGSEVEKAIERILDEIVVRR